MDSEFNATEVLAEVKKARAVRRRRSTWGKSKLIKFRAELLLLRTNGASFGDLQFWLLKKKRVKIDRANIKRFLDKDLSAANQE